MNSDYFIVTLVPVGESTPWFIASKGDHTGYGRSEREAIEDWERSDITVIPCLLVVRNS